MNKCLEVASPNILAGEAYLLLPGASIAAGAATAKPGNVRFVDIDGVANQALRGYVFDVESAAIADEIAALTPVQLGAAGSEGIVYFAPGAIPSTIAAMVKAYRWRANTQDGTGVLIATDVSRTMNVFCPHGMGVLIVNIDGADAFTAPLGVSIGWDMGGPADEGRPVMQVTT